jgi:hypothetical protein
VGPLAAEVGGDRPILATGNAEPDALFDQSVIGMVGPGWRGRDEGLSRGEKTDVPSTFISVDRRDERRAPQGQPAVVAAGAPAVRPTIAERRDHAACLARGGRAWGLAVRRAGRDSEVFLIAFRVADWDPARSAASWLYAIAIRVAANHRRSCTRRRRRARCRRR